MTFSDAINYLERLSPPGRAWSLSVSARYLPTEGCRKLRYDGHFADVMLPRWDILADKFVKEYDSLDEIVHDLTAEYLAGIAKTEAEIGRVDA
jgi:hypothetical protein